MTYIQYPPTGSGTTWTVTCPHCAGARTYTWGTLNTGYGNMNTPVEYKPKHRKEGPAQ